MDSCFPDYSLDDLTKTSHRNVRLVNSSSSYEGQLMVKHQGKWGYMCELTAYQVKIVCQELGYVSGTAMNSKYFKNCKLLLNNRFRPNGCLHDCTYRRMTEVLPT